MVTRKKMVSKSGIVEEDRIYQRAAFPTKHASIKFAA